MLVACEGGDDAEAGRDAGPSGAEAGAKTEAGEGGKDGGGKPSPLRDAEVGSDGAAPDSDGSTVGDADGGDLQTDAGAQEPGSRLIVGVGSFGFRATSSDAATWNYCGEPTEVDNHTPELLRDVNYGDGVFIAVGGDANGMVMRSLDGVHWEEDLHPTTSCPGEVWPQSCLSWMGGVAYGDGTWAAGGGNGAAMRSTDGGKTWTGVHFTPGIPPVRDMVFGKGRFVAGTDKGVAISSDKGVTWTALELAAMSMKVAFGGGQFFAWGGKWNGSGFDRACFVSSDSGKTWPACDATVLAARSFVHDGTQWVALLESGHATSADGKSWKAETTSVSGTLLHDGEQWINISGGQVKVAATLAALASATSVATGGPDATWVVGRVFDANLPVTDVPACEDNR
jgi:hypothetical protein